MNIIFLLVPISFILATLFVIGFILTVKLGQYDDLDTPAYRMLLDNDDTKKFDKNQKSTPGVD